jgi:hypothetical protein
MKFIAFVAATDANISWVFQLGFGGSSGFPSGLAGGGD